MTIQDALNKVMVDVQAVGKHERNTHQGFSFRGIDAVLNAVGPAFRTHQVVCLPRVVESHYDQLEVGSKRTLSGHVRLTVQYTFVGPDGDTLTTIVAAEAMDSGDKATAKAMSVAYRTALLQVLCLPTDEPDPDTASYERAPQEDAEELIALVGAASTDEELRALWGRSAGLPKVHEAILARRELLGG